MDMPLKAPSLGHSGPNALPSQDRISALTVSPGGTEATCVQEPPDDITICVWTGQAKTSWTLRGNAPPMICVGVLLEGVLDMRPAQGPGLTVHPGTTVLHAATRPVAGQDVLIGDSPLRLVDVRYALEVFLPIVTDQAIPLLRDALVPQAPDEIAAPVLCHRPASPAARRIATEIMGGDAFEAPIRALYLRAKALELLAVVMRDMAPGATDTLPARDRKRVVMARHLLEQEYDEPWTTGQLARRVGLSEKKLQAGFRQLVGASVHAHLRAVRMAAAMAMLGQHANVTETAYAVGFSSLSHFSKAFKDHAGVSPRDWAKRHAGP